MNIINEDNYSMIFKRKSFHNMSGEYHLNDIEINEIYNVFKSFTPLVDNIEVDIKICPRKDTSCPRGEYCILLYSEKKDFYLQNIGYLGEQLDLWLASKNISACWYGFGKTIDLVYHGLDFVIMITIEKTIESLFRKDMFKSKRKSLDEIWIGETLPNISNIVRFAPSSCNTQPWICYCEYPKLKVYRYKQPGKRGMIPIKKVTYTNRIDIGIFLLFMDVCLKQENIDYNRELYSDLQYNEDIEKVLVALYKLEIKN